MATSTQRSSRVHVPLLRCHGGDSSDDLWLVEIARADAESKRYPLQAAPRIGRRSQIWHVRTAISIHTEEVRGHWALAYLPYQRTAGAHPPRAVCDPGDGGQGWGIDHCHPIRGLGLNRASSANITTYHTAYITYIPQTDLVIRDDLVPVVAGPYHGSNSVACTSLGRRERVNEPTGQRQSGPAPRCCASSGHVLIYDTAR